MTDKQAGTKSNFDLEGALRLVIFGTPEESQRAADDIAIRFGTAENSHPGIAIDQRAVCEK